MNVKDRIWIAPPSVKKRRGDRWVAAWLLGCALFWLCLYLVLRR